MTKKRLRYFATGEAYNVAERRAEDEGADVQDKNWFEYTVDLFCGGCREMVGSFDSLAETYNGVQRLTKDEAERAAGELVAEVEAGGVSAFTLTACACASAARRAS